MATCIGFIKKGKRLEDDAIGDILGKSPSEVHWNVPGFFSSPEDYYFKSSSFLFLDGEWCLLCCSDDRWNCEGSMCLILEILHSPSNPTLKFQMGIKAENGFEVSGIVRKQFTHDLDASSIYLPVNRRVLSFREQLAPQGHITFFCSFLSSSSENEASQNIPTKGADKLTESFEELFLSGDHHDIIIKVKDQEIRAHKLIIVVRCSVFASMFRHDTTEKNTGVVTIEDCDPEVFREFLSFLYSGKLKNVSADNVIELYVIADKYQVDEVKYECVEFMMRNMSQGTFCDFISMALRHNERDLLNFATDYFVENVKTIIETVKWQSFHKEYPVESYELCIKAITRRIPDCQEVIHVKDIRTSLY